jgi:hypothetical protein
MPRVGFEPTNSVLERAKTVHALDSSVAVMGWCVTYGSEFVASHIFLASLFADRFDPLKLRGFIHVANFNIIKLYSAHRVYSYSPNVTYNKPSLFP